jgi:amidase
LKPTRARNPLGPDFGDMFSGLVAEHAVTISVRDSAALLDATSGYAVGDPYSAPAPLRPFVEEVGQDPGDILRYRSVVNPHLPKALTHHLEKIPLQALIRCLNFLRHRQKDTRLGRSCKVFRSISFPMDQPRSSWRLLHVKV